jgi:hypothetical protein
LLNAKQKNLVLLIFYYFRTNLQKEIMDNNQDEPQDDAAANAVAVAAAIAAARILEERYCLEVCGLNQQMTDTIILEGYSKTTDFSMMSSK